MHRMDLAPQLPNLALDMITNRTKLSFARSDGPLDRAIHLRLLHWDVDRRGRGSPEVPNLLPDLLELRHCVARESSSYIAIAKFI